MFRRFLIAAVVSLAIGLTALAASPAGAGTSTAAHSHKLVVAVKKTMTPAAEKKLSVLVLITQKGGSPAAALATPSKPLTVLQSSSGTYRVKAEIDSSCTGTCSAPSYRISGRADHKLEVIPTCQPKGSGVVCSRIKVVKVH